MEIAYVDPLDRIPLNSGGDWYAYQLLSELAENHTVTHYFTQNARGKRGYLPDRVSFKASRLSATKIWDKLAGHFRLLELLRPDMLVDGSPVRDIKADIVFTNAESYHIARIIAKANQVPLVLVMHDVMWQKWKANRSPLFIPIGLVEHHVLKKASAVVAISAKEHAYAAQHASSEKIFCVPPKVDTNAFNADGADRDYFATDKLKVLFYGSLDRIHNIKAAQYLTKELVPSLRKRGLLKDISINVIGSGRPPRSLKLDRNPDINFLGEVVDVRNYVSSADVVIVPVKNSSGTKIRILESLACGTPVIATPEAAEGLPTRLKSAVHVATKQEGFEEILQRFLTGDLPLTVRVDPATPSEKSATLDDVLHYVGCEGTAKSTSRVVVAQSDKPETSS